MDYRLDELLFQGEEIEEDIELDGARIAMTSHRILVLQPGGDGRHFDHADRPNVTDATVTTSGEPKYRDWTVRGAMYGAVLLVGGILLGYSGTLQQIANVQVDASPDAGAVVQVLDLVVSTLELLAGGLLVSGILAMGATVGLMGLYVHTRRCELIIELAGRDPIRVPVDSEEGERAANLIRHVS